MKLGFVTYQIAHDWDCNTIIENCQKTGFTGVELRTTHAHGVETSLSANEREDVKKLFADSPVDLTGLGSAFEYHVINSQELAENIEGTKEYTILARDVGAEAVKVRPNRLPEGVPAEKTITQIGESLREVATFADDYGVRIRLEVHGHRTSEPQVIREIIDTADHPNLYVCWNCNMTDLDDTGSIDANFELLKDKIDICHIHALWDNYPWARLFQLLRQNHFDGYCLAEISASHDPITVLNYYRKLFETLQQIPETE